MICLPRSFKEARSEFLHLARSKNFSIKSIPLKGLTGKDGEDLFCDVASLGRADAEKVIVISSGVHGVEGFCGSAVQHALLKSNSLQAVEGVLIVLVHALNPFGFSHLQRVNEGNVDINRNFIDFNGPLPIDTSVCDFHESVFPADWSGTSLEKIHSDMSEFVSINGETRFQRDFTRGQYLYKNAPYFGGYEETWSRKVWQNLCDQWAQHAKTFVHLDVHTGLGESGICEVIYAADPGYVGAEYAKSWMGASVVKVLGSEECSSAPISGCMARYIDRFDLVNVGVALEFGTLQVPDVIDALTDSNWLISNPDCDPKIRERIELKTKDAFLQDTVQWRTQVWEQSLRYYEQCLSGLVAM